MERAIRLQKLNAAAVIPRASGAAATMDTFNRCGAPARGGASKWNAMKKSRASARCTVIAYVLLMKAPNRRLVAGGNHGVITSAVSEFVGGGYVPGWVCPM